MIVLRRTGKFGDYYGSPYNASLACTYEQMSLNAKYIYSYLTKEGWTINAISALLGNMQAESSINPGRWQSDRVGGDPYAHGYGMVQWTPYTKYTEWCSSQGYSDPSEMDSNLARIMYEVKNNIQWIGTGSYYGMSFKEFSESTQSVRSLAIGFLLCYERPADQSVDVQNYRASLAEAWYTYLTGVTPVDPSTGSNKKKKGYKFILFNKRRKIYG